MIKILAAATLALLFITTVCGMLVRFGSDAFRDAGGGHMVLGLLTLVLTAVLTVYVFRL